MCWVYFNAGSGFSTLHSSGDIHLSLKVFQVFLSVKFIFGFICKVLAQPKCIYKYSELRIDARWYEIDY